MKFHIQPLDLASLLASEAGYHSPPLLFCKPLNIEQLKVNSCLLNPGDQLTGTIANDRLYVLLHGRVTASEPVGDHRTHFRQNHAVTEVGSIIYQPAHAEFQISCSDDKPTLLLVVELMGESSLLQESVMGLGVASPSTALEQHGQDLEGKILAFDGNTTHLKRLHCFFLVMEEGERVPTHQHRDHGVLMLGLAGEIDLEGERLPSPSLMYYRGGEPHGFEVASPAGFRGLAIEFYREPPLSEKLRSLAREAKASFRRDP